MVFEQENAFKIDTYLSTSGGIACTNRTYRITWEDGTPRDMEVLKIPLEIMTYNFENIRSEYQLLAKERQLGYTLNFEEENDRKIFAGLFEESLKGLKSRELRVDIFKRGQIEPGIITNGGIILNGNRRYMVLKELKEQEQQKKGGNPENYAYLDVVRLPSNLPKKTLLSIQAKVQMAKDFREDYSPINQLLGIRKFKRNGFKSDEIASLLFISENEVNRREFQLDLIDEFLEDNKLDEQYEVIQKYQIIDHFVELIILLEGHGSFSGLEGLDLKKKKETIKKVVFTWLRNNLDNQLVKEKNTMGSRTIIRTIKNIVNSSEYEKVVDEVLKQPSTLEGKRKIHRLMTTATFSVQESKFDQRVIYNAQRIGILLDQISKAIESREYDFDQKELLTIVKENENKIINLIEVLSTENKEQKTDAE